MNWTQPMCDPCWARRQPGIDPVRIKAQYAVEERCAFCGAHTRSGIYVRVDPRTVLYPRD